MRQANALWCVYAVLFAATSVVIGVIWDISWHGTIGRDSFWTPAHMAIYLGGIVSGCACGFLVLRTTFAGSEMDKGAAVRVWGFYGPIGAWICIWGAAAMITSAPLDNWWHSAYGLDVQILSPPHVLLALGIGSIAVGALVMTIALQNRTALAAGVPMNRTRFLPLYAGGLLLAMVLVMATEYSQRIRQHNPLFYEIALGVLPLYIVAIARASRLRWGATVSAAIYMAVMMLQGWLLPLFAAQPRLGPIYVNVTHMVPMTFPLLLVLPAVAVDLLLQRFDTPEATSARRWGLAALIAVAFLAVLIAVQWPFSAFMLSKPSHNWFFFGDNWSYAMTATTYHRRGLFIPGAPAAAWASGLLIALVAGTVASRLGLAWGGWMRKVQR